MAMAGSEMSLPVFKMSEHATLPARGSEFAAGYDLFAAYDGAIAGRGKGIVKTDIAMAIPGGYYGRVAPRSGLAVKKHIDVGAGVIDADYRGNVGVVLFNHSEEEFAVKAGDRIAQLIITKIETPPMLEVGSFEELGDTVRGEGGYGSTGVSGSAGEKRAKPEAH